MLDDLVQRAELRDPLGRRLRPDPGDAGQVVAGLTDQRGQVAVALRADAVSLGHRGRVHPGQFGDATDRVEHGDLVADQLEHVAVATADQHLEAGVAGPAGERRDDVVGLVAGLLHHRDAQRRQHLLDQADLPLERRRARRPAGLVLGVLLGAERVPGDVEGDRDVRGLLVAQHVDQHGGEAVDGVRHLPGLRGQVRGQGEERPVGERVPVQ